MVEPPDGFGASSVATGIGAPITPSFLLVSADAARPSGVSKSSGVSATVFSSNCLSGGIAKGTTGDIGLPTGGGVKSTSGVTIVSLPAAPLPN